MRLGVAVNAVAAAGGFTGNYYSDVVFRGRVDLHSGISNMWYYFGIGGLALAAAFCGHLLRGTVHVMTWDRALQPAALFRYLVRAVGFARQSNK